MLVEYVRNRKKRPIGVVVATGKYKVGWSLCDKKDEWDKEVGMAMAVGRAVLPKNEDPAQTVSRTVANMKQRAVEFYK